MPVVNTFYLSRGKKHTQFTRDSELFLRQLYALHSSSIDPVFLESIRCGGERKFPLQFASYSPGCHFKARRSNLFTVLVFSLVRDSVYFMVLNK